jgi:hypothetical protein
MPQITQIDTDELKDNGLDHVRGFFSTMRLSVSICGLLVGRASSLPVKRASCPPPDAGDPLMRSYQKS